MRSRSRLVASRPAVDARPQQRCPGSVGLRSRARRAARHLPEPRQLQLSVVAFVRRMPPAIIALVPESIARENVLIPIAEENGMLQIVVRNPSDYETILKLQFILARHIQLAVAPEEQIVAAIHRHYG